MCESKGEIDWQWLISQFLLLIHSSVHCSLGLWSTLILLILGSLGLSLHTASNYVVGSSRQQNQALLLTPVIVH